MRIPALLIRQLYTNGSLENVADGVCFGLKNRLFDASVTRISGLRIDDGEIPLERLILELGQQRLPASEITPESPVNFPLREQVLVHADATQLDLGKHRIELAFETKPFGRLKLKIEDAVRDGNHRGASAQLDERSRLPHNRNDNYSSEMVSQRQSFLEERTGVRLQHINQYSFDPAMTAGNIENFTGVAQVPIGFAGPLQVNGEHAQGEFLIPLATTEGSLVASYNRGIKVLNLAGGVTCTVSDDCMQRAPVFTFDSAREARDFRDWVHQQVDPIRCAAEETSSVARLQHIDAFLANKFAFLRFNFATGDAAGQNMVGRATLAACTWILERVDTVRHFYLESNLATDKKASQVNVICTRGKRVTAEVTVPRDILFENLRVEPKAIFDHYNVGNVGALLASANNNGAHSANAITAMFIATGQDVANVAESSAALAFSELTPEGDLYVSLTIPSLIVGTYGGGTSLATQRECLEILDCYGQGKVRRLAEIVAGVALAGEISLAAAISSMDWVAAHERYGRNR